MIIIVFAFCIGVVKAIDIHFKECLLIFDVQFAMFLNLKIFKLLTSF